MFPQGPSGIFSNNAGQYFGTVSAFTPQNFDPEDLEDGITDNTGTHPNGAGRMYNTDTKLKYVWRGDTNNTSTIDNPELVPGDGIIPPALCWYVSLGNTNNYELIADSSFIKVVRILTTINQDEGWQSGEVLNNPPAQLFIGSQGLLQSRLAPDNETVDVNNSYLDITPSNIELTQIDSTTVKIKILFRDITIPWQQLPPSSPPYSVLPFPNTSRFTTKIFININPVEV